VREAPVEPTEAERLPLVYRVPILGGFLRLFKLLMLLLVKGIFTPLQSAMAKRKEERAAAAVEEAPSAADRAAVSVREDKIDRDERVAAAAKPVGAALAVKTPAAPARGAGAAAETKRKVAPASKSAVAIKEEGEKEETKEETPTGAKKPLAGVLRFMRNGAEPVDYGIVGDTAATATATATEAPAAPATKEKARAPAGETITFATEATDTVTEWAVNVATSVPMTEEEILEQKRIQREKMEQRLETLRQNVVQLADDLSYGFNNFQRGIEYLSDEIAEGSVKGWQASKQWVVFEWVAGLAPKWVNSVAETTSLSWQAVSDAQWKANQEAVKRQQREAYMREMREKERAEKDKAEREKPKLAEKEDKEKETAKAKMTQQQKKKKDEGGDKGAPGPPPPLKKETSPPAMKQEPADTTTTTTPAPPPQPKQEAAPKATPLPKETIEFKFPPDETEPKQEETTPAAGREPVTTTAAAAAVSKEERRGSSEPPMIELNMAGNPASLPSVYPFPIHQPRRSAW